MSRSRRRRWPVVVTVVAVVLVAYLVLTTVFFVRPSLGKVDRPQAVVALGGYGDRFQRAVAVARQDGVHQVEVSGLYRGHCRTARGLAVHCFRRQPVSTQGEARAISALARAHHWDRLVIVAGTTQVSRARVRIERCYPGQMAFATVDPVGLSGWIHAIAYDEAAMVKAVVWQWGC